MAVQTATIIALVGAGATGLLDELGALRGVDALRLGEADADGTARISASNGTYVVHDADPLAHVAAAWVEFFDDRSTLGTLELEVETALAAFAAGHRVMPDYYVVLDPESVEGTWRHWWFGALAVEGPRRVLPEPASAWAIRKRLGRLPMAPRWKDPAAWLPDLRFTIPDRTGLAGLG
ncbi:hypothetical protein DEI92_06300 [Curtobacterium sp. MCBD17_034]|uniref:hypothetical protein n=1 Tax=unclassified Curtobacterium TaxID=257496 RepID=UPI000DA9141D|nr:MULTISPECIES: hypothetical protein [unclassified Curtobacterium]PZF61204.1 hypothetical protein DEI92_06300 [Curtobacterium sp. MCBD17_034]PZM33140.1 hypothetical protein DEI90_14325 [Curtobacterium sp. MCBD17_031]